MVYVKMDPFIIIGEIACVWVENNKKIHFYFSHLDNTDFVVHQGS